MNVINPASKNWLNKYLTLIEQGRIIVPIDKINKTSLPVLLRKSAFETGLIFGFPVKTLFYKEQTNRWNKEEMLKVILLEHLLLVYFKNQNGFNKEEIINSLLDFFSCNNQTNKPKLLTKIFNYEPYKKLEKIIDAKVFIPKTHITKVWMNYIQNTLCYIDVIVYNEYLGQKFTPIKTYESYIEKTLYTIVEASKADGKIDSKEKNLIALFLASAPLKKEVIKKLESQTKNLDIKSTLGCLERSRNEIINLYLLDIGVFTVCVDLEVVAEEYEFIYKLNSKLGYSEKELDSAMALTQAFILEQNDKLYFLKHDSEAHKLFNIFTARWLKIIQRNKDKLLIELQESKELVYLVKKSFKEELTEKEKEIVKAQFKDIVKSVPALALFMLPGGTILLPLILKIIPSLLPTAFRDNEIN